MNEVTGLAKLGKWTNTGSTAAKIFKGFLVALGSIPTVFILPGLVIAWHVKFKNPNERSIQTPEQPKDIKPRENELKSKEYQEPTEIKFYKNKDGEDFACDKSYLPLNALKFLLEKKLNISVTKNSDQILNIFEKEIERKGDDNKQKFFFQALRSINYRIASMVNGCNERQYLEVKKFINIVKADKCSNLMNLDERINYLKNKISSAENFYENESAIKILTDKKALKVFNIKSNLDFEINKVMQEANVKAEEIKKLQLDIDGKNNELINKQKNPFNKFGLGDYRIENLNKEIKALECKLKEEEKSLQDKLSTIKLLHLQSDDKEIKKDKDVLSFSKKIEKLTNDNLVILSELGINRKEIDSKVQSFREDLKEKVKLPEDIQKILSEINVNLEKIESSLKNAQQAK